MGVFVSSMAGRTFLSNPSGVVMIFLNPSSSPERNALTFSLVIPS